MDQSFRRGNNPTPVSVRFFTGSHRTSLFSDKEKELLTKFFDNGELISLRGPCAPRLIMR